jgi:hypothetical protein
MKFYVVSQLMAPFWEIGVSVSYKVTFVTDKMQQNLIHFSTFSVDTQYTI